MKKNPYLLFLACVISSSLSASTPDDAGHHKMLQYLKLLPDTLYFNQDYSINLSAMDGHSLSMTIGDYPIAQSNSKVQLFIPWSNREDDRKMLQIYADGNELVGEKPVTILQKLKGGVSQDNDLFKMDDRVLDLNDNIAAEQFVKYQSFDINAERFQAPGMHVSEFTLRATASDEKVYNQGSMITDATRAFMSKLKTGDNVVIENVKCSYQYLGQPVILDLNYSPSITLSPNM